MSNKICTSIVTSTIKLFLTLVILKFLYEILRKGNNFLMDESKNEIIYTAKSNNIWINQP
jgi:hypothetical protein